MRYRFTAHTKDGQRMASTVSARSKKQALDLLRNRKIVVDSLRLDVGGALKRIAMGQIGGVSLRDKLILTRNMALMIKAGITIDNALSIMAEQASSGKLAAILRTIQKDVEAGSTLADAMSQFPKTFDQLYVNIISAAERSGSLSQSLEQLAIQLKRQDELRAKILGALFYPVLVIVSTLTVGMALSIYVLPKITSLFKSFKTQLPWTTRVVIAFANFMSTQTILAVTIVVVIVALITFLVKAKFLKPIWHHVIFFIPAIGKIVKDFNLALFSRTLSTLLISGVPVNQALEITSQTMRNVRYSHALKKMVIAQQSGETLGNLLSQRSDLFPPLVHRMIAVGEESGNLEEALEFIAEFHEEELDYTTKNISSIVEPMMLIIVGVFVAILALAIITPIYQITGSFQAS